MTATMDAVSAARLAGMRVVLRRQIANRPTDSDWHPRLSQTPPLGGWRIWLFKAGRGSGKTRAGAEWIHARVRADATHRVALVGSTAADVRDVMVEGEAGILSTAPRGFRPLYEPSKRRLTWPNGAMATTYSAEEPDRLRGPVHSLAWCDEVAAWRDASKGDALGTTWNNLMLGLRLGDDPQALATTTPRPVRLIIEMLARDDGSVTLTEDTTYANAENLAPQFLDQIVSQYEGTRIGRQELLGELLTDVPGALWSLEDIDRHRAGAAPPLDRIVVGVDPSGGGGENHDEAGIIVVGRSGRADALAHYYTLADVSLNASPDAVAREIVRALRDWNAHRIIAEGNYGGDMVKALIRTIDPETARLVEVVHARQGKAARAQPVAAIYEQGRAHHVGAFPQLEDEMTSWVEGEASPNRLDALAWAITSLSKPAKRMTAA